MATQSVIVRAIRIVLILLAATLTLSRTDAHAAPKNSDDKCKSAIEEVLNKQSAAWNAGKLDEFMDSYLHDEKTSYVSSTSEIYGFDAIRDHYQKRYGNDQKSMGKLTFSDLKVISLGERNALCIGHWHVLSSEKGTLSGVFSLVFQKGQSGWKIIHDHTSLSEKK